MFIAAATAANKTKTQRRSTRSSLVFNLPLASSPPLVFQPLPRLSFFNLFLAFRFPTYLRPFYRMPCSALAKKSLRIHEPALIPGLGSENG